MHCNKLVLAACALLACVSLGVRASLLQSVPSDSRGAPALVAEDDLADSGAETAETDEYTRRLLVAMGEASTVGHPDLRGLFEGMRAFYKGDYPLAMEHFLEGARHAGKQSQLTIGLMYLNGHGVEKDPATACAWLALAAERGYPRYEATRKNVCSALNRRQHAHALYVLDRLLPEYGDDAAVPRMKMALARGMRRSVTGSFLGTDHGVRKSFPRRSAGKCDGFRLQVGDMVIPKQGCGTYETELWHAEEYYEARVPRVRGIVTVGELDDATQSQAEDDQQADQASESAAAGSDED